MVSNIANRCYLQKSTVGYNAGQCNVRWRTVVHNAGQCLLIGVQLGTVEYSAGK